MEQPVKTLLILGTRGIPAEHGGFETFAERYALFLAGRGWSVSVYCQDEVERVTEPVRVDSWRGVNRIFIQTARRGGLATLDFDWKCVRDALTRPGVCLVLGYNGAIFLPILRMFGRKVFTNMDGIEWKRPKWGLPIRGWFWINEWIAAWSSQRLVADHPAIAAHVATRRPRSAITVIPYGGDDIEDAPVEPLAALGLQPDRYMISIARIEPDNNIATLVEAFSVRRRGMKLVVLGDLVKDNAYHAKVRAAAGPEVIFPGAIYDSAITRSLRFHARAYMHGHTVGGTNPSLVEALWAGNAVVAHDNPYNRWTAGAAALYFRDIAGCDAAISRMVEDAPFVAMLGAAARARAGVSFNWTDVLLAYERECLALIAPLGVDMRLAYERECLAVNAPRGTRAIDSRRPATARWI